jgi:hypothetical protein
VRKDSQINEKILSSHVIKEFMWTQNVNAYGKACIRQKIIMHEFYFLTLIKKISL